jgi:hypothetical protein
MDHPLDFVDRYEEQETHSLVDFLYAPPAPRTVPGIIKWWESRRLKYNLIVGGSGVLSLGAIRVLSSLPPNPLHIPYIWQPIVAFAVLANLCYLLGPLGELAVEKLSRGKILPTGPSFFRMGLTFSVGLTLLPTLIFAVDWGIRILRSIF